MSFINQNDVSKHWKKAISNSAIAYDIKYFFEITKLSGYIKA